MATTTAIAFLYQHELLNLHWRLCDERLLGAGFAQGPSAADKALITIKHLLLHTAGYGIKYFKADVSILG